MTFYLDSSVAVSAVSAEPATSAVLEWLAAAEDVLISDWLLTEGAAALSRKRRMRIVSDEELAEASAGLHHVVAAFRTLPVTREDFRAAASFAEQPEIGLRAGDALHLAVAAAAGAALVTLDKGQARAGRLLGVETLLL